MLQNLLWLLGAIFSVILFTLFIGFLIYGFFKEHQRQEAAKRVFRELQKIYNAAKNSEINTAQLDRFSKLSDSCLSFINRSSDEVWKKCSGGMEMLAMRNKIHQMSSVLSTHRASLSIPVSQEIEKLAKLRKQGMISDHEFEAFSERFGVTTGEKAGGIIKAISDLYKQYKNGAMTEGNYHAALWSLLDKLDRKI